MAHNTCLSPAKPDFDVSAILDDARSCLYVMFTPDIQKAEHE